ncbi:MAG: hypothetical protein Q9211_002251 [Gyalolechia sp. 1 TL-2023]
MAQRQLPSSRAGSPNTPTELEDHLEPMSSPPQAPYQCGFSTTALSEISAAQESNFEPPVDPAVPQGSMPRGGSVSTAVGRDTRVFAPSKLVHAQPAPSSSTDGPKEADQPTWKAPAIPLNVGHDHDTEAQGDASSVDHQLLRQTQARSPSVDAKPTHPSLSAYSEMALSFPRANQTSSRRSCSPLRETALGALEPANDDQETPGEPTRVPLRKVPTLSSTPSRLEGDIETPREPALPPGHLLRKVSTGSTSPRQQEAASSPPEREETAVETPGPPTFPPGTPMREVPSLSSNTNCKDRSGPSSSPHEDAFLHRVQNVADKHKNNTTPPSPPRLSFSPISDTDQGRALNPRPIGLAKKKKKTKITEAEDPFEGFNSGSEKDADSDADFDEGGVFSSELSAAEEEEEAGLVSEEEDPTNVGVARQARKGKEEEEEDDGENESPDGIPARRPPGMVRTDYPTASEAFGGVKHMEGATPERSRSSDVSRRFGSEEGAVVGFPGGGDHRKAEGFGDEERRNGKDWALVVSKVGGKRVLEWKILTWRGWMKE